MSNFCKKKQLVTSWSKKLINNICTQFKNIEKDYSSSIAFKSKKWLRNGCSETSSMRDLVFKKIGVNISTAYQDLPKKFAHKIKGYDLKSKKFWSKGIYVVAHMHSLHITSAYFNARMVITIKQWFVGGGD